MATRIDSLALRLLLGAGVWVAVALTVGGLTLSAVFRNVIETAFDQSLTLHMEALISACRLGPDGALELSARPADHRFSRPYSGWYWQIESGERSFLRSRSLWDRVLKVEEGVLRVRGRGRFASAEMRNLRFVAREVHFPGFDSPLSFMVTGGTDDVEAEIRRFNRLLFASLAFFALGLAVAVFLQIRFGLRPLRRIGQALGAVRRGARSRLEGRFPAEIAPLAKEVNSLLAQREEMVARARRHVGNLAHALRTPLAVLANEASAGKGALAAQVRKQGALMGRHVEHYLARARAMASARALGVRSPLAPVARALLRVLARLHPDKDVVFLFRGAERNLVFAGERADLEDMLGNVLENACKWAKRRIALHVSRHRDRLFIVIDDDGSGLQPSARGVAFARGRRLDESAPGSGLGLSIVRDCVDSYHGRVALRRAPGGGLRVTLLLPASEVKEAASGKG